MKKTIALLCCVLLAAAPFSGCTKARSETLYVLNWGAYIDPEVNDMFEEEFDCKVVYTTYDSNESMYVKAKQNSSPCDVVFPSDYMVEKMVREGMLYKLNKANIPNMANIDPKLLGMDYDPGNDYTVPYFWGTVGILYNTAMVNGPVDSWGILWDEQYKGNIIMYDSQRDTIGVALKYLGYSMNSRNMDEITEAEELLVSQKPLVIGYYTDIMQEMLIGEEGALGVTYSGDAVYSITQNPDLAYSVPKEGSNKWFDSAAILETSENKEMAEKYINFLCRDDISLMNAEEVMYSTANKNIEAELRETDWGNSEAYFPTDEIMDRCEIFRDPGEFVTVYSDVWERIKSK
ncbi:MAG: ABC transporter substrate-binding protein [Eubacteriaceae bacterium]|nr:ABC transporter substrate-binding protein [Eubacteriaceae bacterium]